MDKNEFAYEKALTYDQLTQYLLKKYGPATHNYFLKNNCKSKDRRISRTNEGLICHHIYEKYVIKLSDPSCAINAPFEYQKAENLCYCNYLEHFLLHVKIAYHYEPHAIYDSQISYQERTEPVHINWDTACAYNMRKMLPVNGGIDFIGQDINGLYESKGSTVNWRQRCYLEIKDNLDDYTNLLAEMVQTAVDSFTGNKLYKHPIFKVGYKFKSNAEILKIDNFIYSDREEFDKFYIRFPDGHCNWIPRASIDLGDYNKCVDSMIKTYCLDYEGKVSKAVMNSLDKKVKR